MPQAKNGADRGICIKPKGHAQQHSSGTCSSCGVSLTQDNATHSTVVKGSGFCRECFNDYVRQVRGSVLRPIQTPVAAHTFLCGCGGILPERGQSNKFAIWHKHRFACRVAHILHASRIGAKRGNYAPIDPTTPHSVVRAMMEDPNCERCGQPLPWQLGRGTTPHLHHDHTTGEIFGFTHPVCNPRAMQIEIERLKAENRQLRAVKFAA